MFFLLWFDFDLNICRNDRNKLNSMPQIHLQKKKKEKSKLGESNIAVKIIFDFSDIFLALICDWARFIFSALKNKFLQIRRQE